jgi:dipeptidyl aminopeptidase/acylaminoacyl peptidase
MAYVHQGMAPVLLIHGSADPLVPFAQSVDFYERLRAEGVPVRLVAFPRWGHGFDYLRPFNQRKVLALTLDFLAEHMPAPESLEAPAS